MDTKPALRSPTITDVAEAAGVSPMTVSRVLNGRGGAGEETRRRVLEAARALSYRPNAFAKSLKNDRSNTVGIVVPDIVNPFFPEIIRGAELVARPAGYTLLSCNVVEDPEREEEVLGMLLDKRVDGLIICSAHLDDERLLRAIAPHRAVVLINRAAAKRHALHMVRRQIGKVATAELHSMRSIYRPFYVAFYGKYEMGKRIRYLPIEADGHKVERVL